MDPLTHSRDQELEAHLRSVQPWGSYTVLALCLLMFLVTSLAGGSENSWTLLRFGANFPPLTIDAGEWWRLFSCTFLHIGMVHLVCNMITLVWVGVRAEQVYGTARYVALYAFAGLCGSLASALTGESVAAGASGALLGVCGAVVVSGWRHREQWPPAFRRSMFGGIIAMIGCNLLYGLSNSGIDNAAHVGGLLAGGLFALLIRPHALDDKEHRLEKALLALGLIPFLALGWAAQSANRRTALDSYPRRTYTDPSGRLEVTAPVFFRAQTLAEGTFFQGPGLVFSVERLEDPETVTVTNPRFLGLLHNTEGTTSVEVETVAGRSWALRDANSGGAKIRQAFAYFGSSSVKLEVAAAEDQEGGADQLRLMLMASLSPKDYDRLKEAKALSELGLHSRALDELAGVDKTLEAGVLRVSSLIALARYDEAEGLLKVLEEGPSRDASVVKARWSLCRAKDDYEGALKACQEMIALESDPQEKYHRMVDAGAYLERLGRAREAQPLYAEARAGYEDKAHIEADVWNSKAWTLIEQKRYKEALPLAERAVKAEKNRSTLDTRGRALLHLKDWRRAKADFEAILNEDLNEPYANYAIARVLEKEGDVKNARVFYFRYLALAGGDAEVAADALERVNGLDKGR